MPFEIRQVFDETDIEKTWDYLALTFKLNKRKWKVRFEEEFLKSSRAYTKEEWFIRFGRQHFEEALCTLLCREPFRSNTWLGLIKYIVKDKLLEKQKESNKKFMMYRKKNS